MKRMKVFTQMPNTKKVLLNTSVLNVGGGQFVAINFVRFALNDTSIQWFFLLSRTMKERFDEAGLIIPIERCLMVDHSPARLIYNAYYIIVVNRYIAANKIDVVYSIGAPSYLVLMVKEVQRITNPYITHLNKYALSTYPLVPRFKLYLKTLLQRVLISRGKYFVTQTNTAKNGILKYSRAAEESVCVVPNSLSPVFQSNERVEKTSDKKGDKINIFCLSAEYPHKNIQSVPLVLKYLSALTSREILVHTTLDEASETFARMKASAIELGVFNQMINHGRISQQECVGLYLLTDIVFMPSYLETFSATLLEALFCQIPIVTTKFDFNHDICGEYALYFEAGDWKSAADLIIRVIEDKSICERLKMPRIEFDTRFMSYENNYLLTRDFIVGVK